MSRGDTPRRALVLVGLKSLSSSFVAIAAREVLAVEDTRRVAEAGADGTGASNREGLAVGRCGARRTLEPLAVELRTAADLVGRVSGNAARESRTAGGYRRLEPHVRNRGVVQLYGPL